MEDHNVVLLVNASDHPYRYMQGGQWYVLPPAKSAKDAIAVPWIAAKLWFGDSTLRDLGDEPENKFRTQEAARINIKYGMIDRPFYTDTEERSAEDSHGDNVPTNLYHDLAVLEKGNKSRVGYTPDAQVQAAYKFRHPNLPLVNVYTTGADSARIFMVIDDPYGAGDFLAVAEANSAEAVAIHQQMQAQQEQIDRMMAALASKDPALAAELMGGDIGASNVDGADADHAPGAVAFVGGRGDNADPGPKHVDAKVDPGSVDVLDPDVQAAFSSDPTPLPPPPKSPTSKSAASTVPKPAPKKAES